MNETRKNAWRQHIDEHLPRCGTWPPHFYDLTDDEAREEAVEWVATLLANMKLL